MRMTSSSASRTKLTPGASGTRCARAWQRSLVVASGEDPPDRVWPFRSGLARSARAWKTGDLQLPGLHVHLRQIPPRAFPAQAEDPAGPHAREASRGQGGVATANASADPRTGAMAAAGCQWILRLSRRADQQPGVECLPLSHDVSMATLPSAAQPEGWLHVAAGGEAG